MADSRAAPPKSSESRPAALSLKGADTVGGRSGKGARDARVGIDGTVPLAFFLHEFNDPPLLSAHTILRRQDGF